MVDIIAPGHHDAVELRNVGNRRLGLQSRKGRIRIVPEGVHIDVERWRGGHHGDSAVPWRVCKAALPLLRRTARRTAGQHATNRKARQHHQHEQPDFGRCHRKRGNRRSRTARPGPSQFEQGCPNSSLPSILLLVGIRKPAPKTGDGRRMTTR